MNLLELLFPTKIKCILCQKDLNADNVFSMCENCLKQMEFCSGNRCIVCYDKILSSSVVCDSCKYKRPSYIKALSVFDYNKNAKKLILDFKYKKKEYLKAHLAEFLFKKLQEFDVKFDFITFVPNSSSSYNASELLAKELSKLSNIPYKKTLKKTTSTELKNLNAQQRKNLKYCFSEISNLPHNQIILLVDDILTTGATIDACSKILSKNNNKIYALTFARTLK